MNKGHISWMRSRGFRCGAALMAAASLVLLTGCGIGKGPSLNEPNGIVVL